MMKQQETKRIELERKTCRQNWKKIGVEGYKELIDLIQKKLQTQIWKIYIKVIIQELFLGDTRNSLGKGT